MWKYLNCFSEILIFRGGIKEILGEVEFELASVTGTLFGSLVLCNLTSIIGLGSISLFRWWTFFFSMAWSICSLSGALFGFTEKTSSHWMELSEALPPPFMTSPLTSFLRLDNCPWKLEWNNYRQATFYCCFIYGVISQIIPMIICSCELQ